MEIAGLGRLLIVLGVALALAGVMLLLASKIPFLGRLPGDLVLRRDSFTLVVPIVTMLLFSVVSTVLLNLIWRILR